MNTETLRANLSTFLHAGGNLFSVGVGRGRRSTFNTPSPNRGRAVSTVDGDATSTRTRARAGKRARQGKARRTPERKTRSQPSAQATNQYWRNIALFGGLFVAALVLRMYRLADESPWVDEVLTLEHLQARSLRMYLDLLREKNPAHTEGYFTALYFYSRLIGDSVYAMRLLSVAAGMATIALTFVIAMRMERPLAGLIAAGALSVSRFHIYYSQELRPYAFVALCAVMSMWLLYEYLRSGNGAWLFSTAGANAILIWMHPLGALLVGAQLLVLIGLRPYGAGRFGIWCGLQAAVIAVFLPWYSELKYYHEDAAMVWLDAPTFSDILKTTFVELPGSSTSWWDHFPLVAGYPVFHFIVAGILIFLAAFTICRILGRRRTKADTDIERLDLVFLVFWTFVPLAAAIAISHYYKPVFWGRYQIYCAPALALLIGVSVTLLRSMVLRWALVAILTVCYGVLHATSERPLRLDWERAMAHIENNATSNEMICYMPAYGAGLFDYYFEGECDAIKGYDDVKAVVDVVVSTRTNQTVWILVDGTVTYPLRQMFDEQDILYAGTPFPSSWGHLTVFKCSTIQE